MRNRKQYNTTAVDKLLAAVYNLIMKTITCKSEYFNPKDTIECGQVFRYYQHEKGYILYSADKACYIYCENEQTHIKAEDCDADYFYNYFDLDRNYFDIVRHASSFNVDYLTKAANAAKGLRLLNQDKQETLFSFIISQNNNIPRIKKIIEGICRALGERKFFMGKEYYTFPTATALASASASLYKSLGAGYRDEFICQVAQRVSKEGIAHLDNLSAQELKKELLTYKGVGPKVADCVALFAYKKTESFPVDTWIKKVYKEDLGGTQTDRKKIAAHLQNTFGEYSGFVQQYLFYFKRQN